MSIQFTTLDVFTTSAFEGNPLAVVTIPPPSQQAPLTQSQKQRIAREFNLSETVFVHDVENRAETDERKIDIFTPQFELPFAGHPTIGTAVFLQPQGVKMLSFTRNVCQSMKLKLVGMVNSPKLLPLTRAHRCLASSTG
jgi:PhzF family phenazine biosynthesis protein